MKNIRKYISVVIYILLILICAGIVRLLGEWNRVDERPAQSASEETESAEASLPGPMPGTATPSGADKADQDLEEEYEKCLAGLALPDEDSSAERLKRAGGESGEAESEEEEEPYVPPTVMFASDLHYMSATTHDDGYAFWQMVEGDDGKTTQYSDEMIDALLAEAVRTKPAALVLCGDLTLNGERENHEKLAEKLAKVQEAGVPVVVIPGNHDINKPDAAVYFGRFSEEAETLTCAEDFYDIYHAFGYDQSPNRDPDSLSYVYPVDATHWLLMIDSCQYEDGNQVNGRIRPETLRWLSAHLQVAKENGIQVLPVAHHNLLSESRLYTT
ncbi:MAG: metallophosphoesterase, partial [Clostridiales bacterium]|nr:metallophosphoesterase [Clostridiales bacterium]